MAKQKTDNLKNHMVKLRMTDEEYNRLQSYADQNNMKMSQVIRKSLEETYKTSKDK